MSRAKYTPEELELLAKSLYEWAKDGFIKNEFKLLSEWSLRNEVPKQSLTHFAERNESFKEAFQFAKEYQEHAVVKGGFSKKLDGSFCMFFLQCNCKWRRLDDTQDKESAAKSNLEKVSDALTGKLTLNDRIEEE